jgi:hypothetical protein
LVVVIVVVIVVIAIILVINDILRVPSIVIINISNVKVLARFYGVV